MRKKKGIFLTFMYLMVFIPTIAANSVARERIWIKNDLENSITVYCDFQHKDGNTTQNFPSYWNQPLLGRGVTCDSFLESGEKRVYKANTTIKLVEYFPSTPIHEVFMETLQILSETPLEPELKLEQKLKELFKTLVISDAEGKVLLTLDDFSKARVERNNRRYTIIIGDYLYQ